jgi:hypothetical protein
MKAMTQVLKQGAKTAASMFSVWMVMLAVLAALPGTSIGGNGHRPDGVPAGSQVLFVPSQTNTTIQDIDGTVSVQVRTLRPVVVNTTYPGPM